MTNKKLGSGESSLETAISYMLIVGVIVSLTIVGLVIGVPLIIFGFLLVVRSLF